MKPVNLTFKRIDGRPAYVLTSRARFGSPSRRVGLAMRTLSGLWQVRVDGKVVGRGQRLRTALDAAGFFPAVTS